MGSVFFPPGKVMVRVKSGEAFVKRIDIVRGIPVLRWLLRMWPKNSEIVRPFYHFKMKWKMSSIWSENWKKNDARMVTDRITKLNVWGSWENPIWLYRFPSKKYSGVRDRVGQPSAGVRKKSGWWGALTFWQAAFFCPLLQGENRRKENKKRGWSREVRN